LVTLIDSFLASRIFGADRLAHFRAQSATLASELQGSNDDQRARIAKQVGEVDQRIERQPAAIEAGVDPVLVGERIRNLKAEREEAQATLAQLEASHRDSTAVDPADALAVLSALPDLDKSLLAADPDIRRAVFDAFRLRVEIDRNSGQIRLKALVSSAFGKATNLSDLEEAGDSALSVKAIPPARHKSNHVARVGAGPISLAHRASR
jgi:hypothetical protein